MTRDNNSMVIGEVRAVTSVAKIESNRRNARRSTGPRTQEGKAVASSNALRHGILSRVVTLPEEDRQAFDELSERMTARLAPEGPLEQCLVERITESVWRLRRVARAEAGVMTHRTSEARADLESSGRSGDAFAVGLIRDATGADTMSKLSRYERGLERGLYRALHELERLQAARRGDHVPPPAVVDIQVSGEEE